MAISESMRQEGPDEFSHIRQKDFAMAGGKYWSGQECPKTATYGQYNDATGTYAGSSSDRRVEKGERFPPSQNNHHFEEK